MLKGNYLKALTSRLRMKSADIGKKLDGSSPPSVFIGAWNYPNVYAGPMVAQEHGDTSMMDTPESWIPSHKTTEDILGYRLNLIRGKQEVKVTDAAKGSVLIEKLQDITLASNSIDSQVEFINQPRGLSLSDEHTTYGPSGDMQSFDIGNAKWDQSMQKAYYDTDLKAAEAVIELHSKGTPFSRIQKAFSTGSFGMEKKRRLVPTRWSITACDTILGNKMLEEVRQNEIIDHFEVREFRSLNNYYAVILLPTAWQYEWTEAFNHIMGNEEMVFSDYERNSGKKGYSTVGGCYYSCKMGVLETLAKEKKQAGAIILREATHGYIPLGVFNVRENVRNAMQQPGTEFNSFGDALHHISPNYQLPISRFVQTGPLTKENLKTKQTTLSV